MHGGDEKYIMFWLKSLKGMDHLKDLGIDGKVWTEFIWLRIETSHECL
jgi:hypothetical protein